MYSGYNTNCHPIVKYVFKFIELQSNNYLNNAWIIILFTGYYPVKKYKPGYSAVQRYCEAFNIDVAEAHTC